MNNHKSWCEMSSKGWSASIPPKCTCDMPHPHTEEMNTECCEKCLGSYVTGRDTRGCVENGCPCHKNSIWEKDWYEFCKLGGLHCTEEVQVMEIKIKEHFLSKRKEELESIKRGVEELGHQQDDDTIWCNMDEVLALLNKHISNK